MARGRVRRGRRTTLGAALFVLAVAVVGWRIWHRLDQTTPPFAIESALVDFRDAVYYPVVATLEGENPYDAARMRARYPVNGTIGLYSPLTLLLHLPWGLLPYRAAELGFVLWSLGLVLVLATAAWRIAGRPVAAGAVATFAAVLVITRPGHWNLFLGQVALEAALATLAALWWARTRPLAAGLGFAVTTFKATYAAPLLVLLAARRDWRALASGIVVALVLTLPALGVVVARTGVDGLVNALVANYRDRVGTPRMSAAVSTFRVDVVALAGRALGATPSLVVTLALTAAVLAAAALVLGRLADRGDYDARRRSLAIATLALVLCTYHQQYDLLVLAPLLLMAWPSRATPLGSDRLAGGLVAIPFVNYLATGGMERSTGAGDGTILMLSSLNILALLGAFALFVRTAWRVEPTR
jgi:hypothetical protein